MEPGAEVMSAVDHTSEPADGPPLTRGIGPWQATALNVTMIVGAGVFVTIPYMLGALPGPYALLGWVAAGVLILMDGLVWSELGAAMPGSGGSYHYLLECYGRDSWGRLFAFLFIWQFLLSGPLELGSGLVAIAQFSSSLSPAFQEFNQAWTWRYVLWERENVAVSFGPARLLAFLVGLGIVALLRRNITTLGRLTVTVWLGVMGVIAWVLVEGALRFDPAVAFDFSGAAAAPPDFVGKLGPAMVLAIYSYLGYYNVCYVGEEVRQPEKTIPRAILLSAAIVIVLFVAMHLAMLGVVSWKEVIEKPGDYSLPAEFMRQAHGDWAAVLITVLLIGCCFASSFSGLLGYSRIPYSAAREGHFFSAFDRLHPSGRYPHFSLYLVGGMTLIWAFFDLQVVINAMITTRLLEMFCGQIIGLMLLRRYRPEVYRPWKMALYPLPCLLALVGWLYLYVASGWVYILAGAAALGSGVVVYLAWARSRKLWPFADRPATPS
jgi:basic amino acid/polyamine antiporter, APA family